MKLSDEQVFRTYNDILRIIREVDEYPEVKACFSKGFDAFCKVYYDRIADYLHRQGR